MIESWRRHYNTLRPHGSLGYKPPASEVFVPELVAAGFAILASYATRAGPEADNTLTFRVDLSVGGRPGPVTAPRSSRKDVLG